ncbi:MAG TPA: AAA family ATPase [Methanoregulaceae archaeon]|nr:AAA family ATPase [Methanoregulaceae archaeon]
MGRIHELKIRNYRGLVDVEISPRRINILVGRNNSGKSSVLEALALHLCSRNGFLDSAGNDLWRCLTRQRHYDPRFFVNTAADRATVAVSDDTTKASLVVERYRAGTPDNGRAGLIMNYYRERVEEYLGRFLLRTPVKYVARDRGTTLLSVIDAYGRQTRLDETDNVPDQENEPDINEVLDTMRAPLLSALIESEKMVLTRTEGEAVTDLYLHHRGIAKGEERGSIVYRFAQEMRSPGPESVRGEGQVDPKCVFEFDRSVSPVEMNRLHDLVVERSRIQATLGYLKQQIGYLTDIRKTDEGIQVFLEGQDGPLPLSSMGEGFIALLKTVFVSSLLDDGRVIIEEPEYALHPGFVDLLSNHMLTSSPGLQYFVSTHSNDFVRSMLEAADAMECLDDVLVLRLHKRLDTLNPDLEPMGGAEALTAMREICLDLRGI